jgi:Nif-specific regulatory protein
MNDRLLMVESELDTLYLVSQLLNSRLDIRDKLQKILALLHQRSDLNFGMITLRDEEGMSICEIYGEGIDRSVRYQIGEGLVGAILDEGATIVVERISDEPRFLSRLGVYNPDLPFIGSPLAVKEGEVVGILAAQPSNAKFLGERARFMEMVANLIAHSVNMVQIMERKHNALESERDYLKQTLEQLAKRLKESLFMARLAKKKEKHPL